MNGIFQILVNSSKAEKREPLKRGWDHIFSSIKQKPPLAMGDVICEMM
jgi:hypothetical protein